MAALYKIAMMTRASLLVAASYRMETVLSVFSLLATLVPVYFVAGALQPVMAESIAAEGGEYFGFLVIGMIVYLFLANAVNALPGAIRGGIGSGTLEAMFTTPTTLPTLLGGMLGYGFLWVWLRALVMLTGAWVLGMGVEWTKLAVAVGIVLLIVLAYLPFGLFAAALILVARTTGPLPSAVLVVSGLLGGIYYPTRVIPSWIGAISDWIPLTYGLRALRRTLLDGLPFQAVLGDVAILSAFAAILLLAGSLSFLAALRYGRRTGTLAHY
jgi:ABC-2 type transport system permease protein